MKQSHYRLIAKNGLVPVKVSARSARLRFIACGPTCISLKNCKAKCCDAPTTPTGIRVYVHKSEQANIERQGVRVVSGFIQPFEGTRVCPFKSPEGLCNLFGKPERPLGCIVSPFAFNKTGTLILRNRYKLLPCYDREGELAYRVFRESLVAIFGEEQTKQLVKHLDKGGGDLVLMVKKSIYEILTHREQALHKGG